MKVSRTMIHMTTKNGLYPLAVSLVCLAVTLAAPSWPLLAQETTPPGFRAYPLRYAQATEVAQQLQKMLDELGTRQEVLADRSNNRLLIRGAEDAVELADQLVRTLDRPPAMPAAPQPARPPVVARGYAVDPTALEATLAEIRKQFPVDTGVRAAADERTGQIIIVAPEQVHGQIARILAPFLDARLGAAGPSEAIPAAVRNGHRLMHLTWRDLEEELARAWGQRLLRSTSQDGSVATIHAQAAGGPYPVIQIDRRNNTVSFPGSPAVAGGWARVVQALDQPRGAGTQQTQLVPVDKADPNQVRQAVTLIQEASRDGAAGEADMVSMIFQPQAEEAGPAAEAGPPGEAPPAGEQPAGETGEGDELDMAGGVIGPVQIEYLEGLDVIVLRGQRRDVERVQKIIEDIERLSQVTQPSIEIHRLRFVGSQVMSQLVTEIYDEILSPRQGAVTIRPLVKPNALLLIGRPESVSIVKELITKLDQPVAADTQFEVFQLKHISALDAEETINSFFVDRFTQAQQAGQAAGALRPGLGTRVNVVADYRSNQLIVQASPRDMEEVRRLLERIDVESTASTNELRIFRLKNALASDIAPVLQDALNWQLIGNRTPVGASTSGVLGGGFGAGVGQAEERARIRSAILTFMTVDSEGGKLLESGLLSDVRVTADVNGNALIVTGPSKSMDLISALVKELDTLPSAKAQIKVFTIVNGDATALASMLQQLLGQTAQGAQQAFTTLFGQGAINPFLTPGLQSAASIGESSLVPVRFGVDQRTNSIIATGSEGDLGVVEAILLRLDEESLRKQQTVVYWLANVQATEVAAAVNDWLDQRSQLFAQQLQISPESPEVQINREIIVVAETLSNSIIISAAPSLIEEIQKVVEALDRRPPLVKIDVLIAEVALTDFFEFGAEYGLQDGLLFDRTNATGDQVGYNFNNTSLGNLGPAGNNVLGQALSTFGLGRISGEQGYGGLVLSASSNSVSVLIRALQERGRLQILSRPTVTTMDGQAASVTVGATVSRLAGTVLNNNTSQQNVEDVPTGIILGVTPRVTPEGIVVMEIDVTKSKVSDTEGVDLPAGDGGTFFQPNIDQINAASTISARNGQTVVFAGLIQTTKSDLVRGIPWLADLPVVGPIFSFKTKSERRGELLIVMTPRIIYANDEEEIDWIKYAETERMSWCLADVAQMYSTEGMSARPGYWCVCPDMPVIYPDANPIGMPIGVHGAPGPVEDFPLQPMPETEAVPAPGPVLPPTPGGVIPSEPANPDNAFYGPGQAVTTAAYNAQILGNPVPAHDSGRTQGNFPTPQYSPVPRPPVQGPVPYGMR